MHAKKSENKMALGAFKDIVNETNPRFRCQKLSRKSFIFFQVNFFPAENTRVKY